LSVSSLCVFSCAAQADLLIYVIDSEIQVARFHRYRINNTTDK
jgi:hypothetical protein